MHRLRPYPVAGFAAVTLVIWVNRIWLAWTNNEDTVAEKLVWSTPVTAFVLAGAAVLVLQARGADARRGRFRGLVRAFAAGTVAYWAIRLPFILVAEPPASVDSPAAFRAVHAVLAAASVAAAVLAWRSVAHAVPVTAKGPPDRYEFGRAAGAAPSRK